MSNDLAVHLQDQAEHPVRGRVRGTHVQDELLAHYVRRGFFAGFELHRRARGGVEGFNFSRDGRHGGEYPPRPQSGNPIL